VLVDCSDALCKVVQHAHRPFPAALSAEFLSLNSPGPDELHRAALAANALTRVYAQVVAELLARAGIKAASVTAIGAHGRIAGDKEIVFHPMIAAAPSGLPIHTPEFATHARDAGGDQAVIDGAVAMAWTVADLWLDADAARAVEDEFAATVAGVGEEARRSAIDGTSGA